MEKDEARKIILAYKVCRACGLKYGHGPRSLTSTWTVGGKCDICEEQKDTTEFRDFGYARGEFYAEFPRCSSCDGKGYMLFGDKCPSCHGIGYML